MMRQLLTDIDGYRRFLQLWVIRRHTQAKFIYINKNKCYFQSIQIDLLLFTLCVLQSPTPLEHAIYDVVQTTFVHIILVCCCFVYILFWQKIKIFWIKIWIFKSTCSMPCVCKTKWCFWCIWNCKKKIKLLIP